MYKRVDMARRGYHQREHKRTNARGTEFAAGRQRAMTGHVTNLEDFYPELYYDVPAGFDAPLRFSIGMNKMIHSSIPVWNLPVIKTCPGKTAACVRYCYALSTDKTRPGALRSRERNLRYSLRKDFVARANTWLKIHNPSYVRVHESGDFYGESYFQKWLRIAQLNPGIKFLAFTRTPINYSKYHIPSNFTLIYSIDDTTHVHHLTSQTLPKHKAYVGDENKYKSFSCPKNTDPFAGCTPVVGLDANHERSRRGGEPVVFSQRCLACWNGVNVFLKRRGRRS